MSVAWRLVPEQRAGEPLSGEGARLYGGRWNEVGLPVIYASENRSLAALEVLVHLNGVYPRRRYKLLSYELDDRLIETLASSHLPSDWREEPPSPSTTQWGSEWAKAKRSLALTVPSAVMPEEKNIILNPLHADFAKIKVGRAIDFAFDPRLFRAGK